MMKQRKVKDRFRFMKEKNCLSLKSIRGMAGHECGGIAEKMRVLCRHPISNVHCMTRASFNDQTPDLANQFNVLRVEDRSLIF